MDYTFQTSELIVAKYLSVELFLGSYSNSGSRGTGMRKAQRSEGKRAIEKLERLCVLEEVVFVWAHMCACLWRPKVNPEHCSSGTIHLFFREKGGISISLEPMTLLAWLPSESWVSACLYPPLLG